MYMYMYIVRGGDIVITKAVHVHKSYRLAVAVKYFLLLYLRKTFVYDDEVL